ncbi:MAG: hypothetical protein AAGC58_06665 [Asticcacaulis sp.]
MHVTIHAGDFQTGKHSFFGYQGFKLATPEMGWTGFKLVTYPASQIESVEVASEESVKKLGGTVGWGAAGAMIFGPVGLLAGLLLGGRKNEVTFIAVFKDGKKILATTDAKTFTQIRAATF